MTKVYITEVKLRDIDSWEIVGFYTDLPYLGFTCKTGGFQNYIGSIELVRYRTYDSTTMPEVNDYLDLIGNAPPVDLGPYTILNQEDLHRLDREYQTEKTKRLSNKVEIQTIRNILDQNSKTSTAYSSETQSI